MSLETTYDPENIFAKIIKGDIPSTKVYEDDNVLSFMDAFPQSKGHTLVISKTAQAVNLLDIPNEALADLIVKTKMVAGAVKDALSPDGIRIVQFNGAPAGQSVFHLHFHIIPVYEGVSLGAHGGGQADPAELQTLSTQIKEKLPNA